MKEFMITAVGAVAVVFIIFLAILAGALYESGALPWYMW